MRGSTLVAVLACVLAAPTAAMSCGLTSEISAWLVDEWQSRCLDRTPLFGPAPLATDFTIVAVDDLSCSLAVPTDGQHPERPLFWTASSARGSLNMQAKADEPLDNEFCEMTGLHGTVISAEEVAAAIRGVKAAAATCGVTELDVAACVISPGGTTTHGISQIVPGGRHVEFVVAVRNGADIDGTVAVEVVDIEAANVDDDHPAVGLWATDTANLATDVCGIKEGAAQRRLIDAHNARYAAGEETFAMRTPVNRRLGHAAADPASLPPPNRRVAAADLMTAEALAALPAAWDFRAAYPTCVFRAQSQRQCGSCWAFAVVGAFEKQICKTTNGAMRPQLSRQNLVDCGSESRGCNGGNAFYSHPEMAEHGLVTSSCLTYYSGCTDTPKCSSGCGSGQCNAHDASHASCSQRFYAKKALSASDVSAEAGIMHDERYGGYSNFYDTYKQLYMKDGEAALKAAIYTFGGVYISVDVYSNFMSYSHGIYSAKSGGRQGGHAMQAIGWGSESGVDYWIVENSWGNAWGEGKDFKRCSESVCEGDFCRSSSRRRLKSTSAAAYHATSCGYMRIRRGANVVDIEAGSSATVYDPSRGPQATFTDHRETMSGPSSCSGVAGQVAAPTIIGGGTRFPTPGPSSGAAAGGGGGSTPAPAPAPAASADCSLRTALWSLAISPSVTLAAAVIRRVTVGTTYDMVWSSSAPPTANDRLEVWAGGASVRSVALELNAARSIGECGKQSTVRLSFTDGDITAQTNAGQGYVSLRVAGGQVFGDADFKVEVVSPADTSCSGT